MPNYICQNYSESDSICTDPNTYICITITSETCRIENSN